jgi:urease accessory protein
VSLVGSACAVVEEVDGQNRYTTLRSQVPLSLRPTPDGLTVVASAFGPLGGDRTELSVVLGDRVGLRIGSAGAQVAQPGAHDPVSTAQVRLRAGADARLTWHPEPVVVTAGAEHRQSLQVQLEAGARAVLVETVVLGTGVGPPGRFRSRWRVSYDGVPLLATDLDVGVGAAAGWDGPAVVDGARVLVSVLVAGPDLPAPDLTVPGGELLCLAGPGALLTWLGHDTVAARNAVRTVLQRRAVPATAACSRP